MFEGTKRSGTGRPFEKSMSKFYDRLGGYLAPIAGAGEIWHVDNGATTGGDGKSWDTAFDTIQEAVTACSAGDVIYVQGTTTDYDEAVTCTKDRITFIGIGFGVECGGWNADADATCLTLSGAKGSKVFGFLFRSDGATSGCAIDISETVANDSDSIEIAYNVFKSTGTTAKYGIKANGCPGYVKIYNNHFTWLDEAISCTSAPNTSATGWEIIDNYFSDKCTKGIYMPLRRCLIKGNAFSTMTTACDTVGYAATNGDYNNVHGNWFGGSYSQAVYQAQTNDDWAGNYSMDTAETEVADNGITIAVPAA